MTDLSNIHKGRIKSNFLKSDEKRKKIIPKKFWKKVEDV